MHTLANELGPKGIRVIAVHPTNANSIFAEERDLLRTSSARTSSTPPSRILATRSPPCTRCPTFAWVEPIDITNAIIFLASGNRDTSLASTSPSTPAEARRSARRAPHRTTRRVALVQNATDPSAFRG
ncbi:MAG TPA: hypothetical protein VIW24_07375 [Aldersonia sp.]